MEFLSDIELYYSKDITGDIVILSGEEKDHAIKVMRHSEEDELFITDGQGKIFTTKITGIDKERILAQVSAVRSYENPFENFVFCIPKLRSHERFEFALEKCTEMGITNIIVYSAVRGVVKGEKKERWKKIVVSAMKQALRAYLPELSYINRLSELNNFPGQKIILDQHGTENLNFKKFDPGEKYFFIFGPEGGLEPSEIQSLKRTFYFKLADNRLRTETAVVKAAALLT